MDKSRLNELLASPASVTSEEQVELEDLHQEYPYFQAILPVLTYSKKKFSPKEYKNSIASTAIHTLDRKHLKYLFKEMEANSGTDNAVSAVNASENNPEVATDSQNNDQVNAIEVRPNEKKNAQTEKIEAIQVENNHLTDEFFQEFFDQINKLQESKKQYQQTLKKIEDSDTDKKKKTSTQRKNKKTGTTTKSAKSTASKSAKSKSSAGTKTSETKKTSKKASGTKASTTKKTSASTKSSTKKTASKSKTTGATTAQKNSAKKTSKSSKSKKNTEEESQDYLDEISKLEEKKIKDSSKKEQLLIIDKFINNEPQIKKAAISDQERKEAIEDLSSRSTQLHDDVVSETLAKLMIQQSRFEKAIDIYKKLIWKFPQKKSYFADQIKELKKQL